MPLHGGTSWLQPLKQTKKRFVHLYKGIRFLLLIRIVGKVENNPSEIPTPRLAAYLSPCQYNDGSATRMSFIGERNSSLKGDQYLTYTRLTFGVLGPEVWNKLPHDLRLNNIQNLNLKLIFSDNLIHRSCITPKLHSR